jgi:hypothetical protein
MIPNLFEEIKAPENKQQIIEESKSGEPILGHVIDKNSLGYQ